MSRPSITAAQFEHYGKYLKEPSRPPSRGGNTRALHQHVITIRGQKYSFLALGSQQWAFKSDNVSFEYDVVNGYKNIDKSTFKTVDSNGKVVVRGNRGTKPKLRTAQTRMPAKRSEWTN